MRAKETHKMRSLNEETRVVHEIGIYFWFPYNLTANSINEEFVEGNLKMGFGVGESTSN